MSLLADLLASASKLVPTPELFADLFAGHLRGLVAALGIGLGVGPFTGGAAPGGGGGESAAPTDITLSGGSVLDNATAGTQVGTVTVVDADSSGLNSLTCSNAKFEIGTITGKTAPLLLSAAGAGNITAGVDETMTFSAQDDSGNDFGPSAARTVTVADHTAETLLSVVTVTENGTGAKTNEVVTLGFPMAAAALAGGKLLRVYDDDGAGGQGAVLANFQPDYMSSDGNGAKRLGRLTGILPALGNGATRKLRVVASLASLPSGTAITASDLLATAFRFRVKFDIAGTEYIFDSDDALAAGETFALADYSCIVASSGPACTEFFLQGPPKNAGSAHASGNGLRVYAAVRAFKAGTGAVDGGNPITLAYADVWVRNGAVDRASPANYHYGYTIERATSLSVGTLITSDDADVDGNVLRYAYPRSQPAATLTATGADSTGDKTGWSISAGSWAVDILGAHITDGTGFAYVTARTSPTTINVRVYKAFSGTSFTSGNWTIEGVGHAYNVTMPKRRIWVGTKPSNVAIWGNLTSAISANSRAPLDYIVSTRLYMNNQRTFAAVSYDMGGLNFARASDGSRRPLTIFDGSIGDLVTFIGQGGWVDTIGPLPVWGIDALAKHTAEGRRKIFENAEYWATWQWTIAPRMSGSPTNGQLGVTARIDDVRYKWNPAFIGTQINNAADNWWPFDTDTAHQSASCYPAYLLTGDLFWLIALQSQAAYCAEVAIFGSDNVNKTPWGDAGGTEPGAGGAGQMRAQAWVTRDEMYAGISTPDSISNKIAIPKSYYLTRMGKYWDAAVYKLVGDPLGERPGANNQPSWLGKGGGATAARGDLDISTVIDFHPEWQMNFCRIAMGMAYGLGFYDEDAAAFQQWMSDGVVAQFATDNAIVPDHWWSSYFDVVNTPTGAYSSLPSTWEEIYRRSCLLGGGISGGGGRARVPTGTASLSDNTVGSGRTLTFSNDFFSNGGSWYVGGYITHCGANDDINTGDGLFKITAVSGDGLTLTGDVIVAFAAAGAQTIGKLRIPGPHRLDYNDEFKAFLGDYMQFMHAACCMDVAAGINATEQADIATYMRGISGYGTVQYRPAFDVREW